MIPEAILCHMTPGRFRLKVPSRKGDAGYFSSLKDHITHLNGVGQIETNELTGSVLIMYGGDLSTVAAFAEGKALFRLKTTKPATLTVSRNIVGAFKDFDGRVKRFTSNEIDVPAVAFLTLLGFGIYEIGRGNFAAPAWYTVFWYALNIFLKSIPEADQIEQEP